MNWLLMVNADTLSLYFLSDYHILQAGYTLLGSKIKIPQISRALSIVYLILHNETLYGQYIRVVHTKPIYYQCAVRSEK